MHCSSCSHVFPLRHSPGNYIVVVILTVQCGILDRRISHAHEIVTADGSEDDIGGYLGAYLLARILTAFSLTLQQQLVR